MRSPAAIIAAVADVVVTQGLIHDYGEVVALQNVDVSIPAGITGLVGANGAGKTTLLRILLGLLHPTRGSVSVLGHDAITDPLAVRSRTGYMPENNCLPKDQTAADFVSYAAELAGLPGDEAKRRSSETLYLVGLEEERFRYIGDFSTGMAQRVKLAQAIVHGPEVVLLDEPASGLDPAGRDQMLELILRLGEFGINVIFSSHVLPDIEDTCDWVVMLDGGRLVRSGPVSQLSGAPALAIEIIGDPARLVQALIEQGLAASLHHHTVTVEAIDESSYDLIRDSIARLEFGLLRLAPVSRSLEDEFMIRAE